MESNFFNHMEDTINYGNIQIIDDLYQEYQKNPANVPASWRRYFENEQEDTPQEYMYAPPDESLVSEMHVLDLIEGYRQYGHLAATINPIAVEKNAQPSELAIERYGFTQSDLDVEFPTCGLLKQEVAPLSVIVETLKETYCNKIGVSICMSNLPILRNGCSSR